MKTLQQVYKIPAEKLLVGSPYYSRGWKGVTGGVNGMYANATGAATGSWDNPQSPGGQYPYFTLKTMENQNGYVKYRDDTYAKTPWLYNASQGIVFSYEDTTSLGVRCDYINSNGYGGLIVWDISGDTSNYELTTLASQKLLGSTTQTVAAPAFNPAAGTYTSAQTVTITCATSGAEIRYTTDVTEPTASSALYSSAITVSSTTTVKAKAFKSGMNSSATTTAVYTIGNTQTVATPVFNPAGGTYSSAQTVTITCATSGAEIRYTTDGTEPTASSALYSSPITVSSTTTIKAKAFMTGMTSSTTVTQTYTISSTQIAAWTIGTAYKVGDLVTYSGKTYKCVQPHTALAG
jgi:chitinase